MDSSRDYGESPVSKVQMLCLKLREAKQIVREKDAKLQKIDRVNKELDLEIETLRKNARDQNSLVQWQKNELEKLTSYISILHQKLGEMENATFELATKLKEVETEKRETGAELEKLKEEIDIGVDTLISGDPLNDESSPIKQDDESTRDTILLSQNQPNTHNQTGDIIQNFARAIKVEKNEADYFQHSSISEGNAGRATTPVLAKVCFELEEKRFYNTQHELPSTSTNTQPLKPSRVSMSARSTTHERDLKMPGFCCSCGSTFSNGRNLNKHVKNFIWKFWCNKCEKGFPYRSLVKKHLLNKHNVVLAGTDFRCELCGKQFLDRASFIQHYKTDHIEVHKLYIAVSDGLRMDSGSLKNRSDGRPDKMDSEKPKCSLQLPI